MAKAPKANESTSEPAADAVPDDQVVTMGDLDAAGDPDQVAQDIMDAQAGNPPADGDDAPQTRTVTIAGQSFEVTPEVAEAMEAQQAEYTRQVAGLQSVQQPQQPAAEPPPPTQWGDKMFTDPDGFVNDLRAEITSDLRKQYGADQQRQRFWDGFYRANDDLREYNDIVESTLRANSAMLGPMPQEQAATKLADMTRERIMGVVSKFGGKGEGKKSRTTVESGKGPKPKKASASQEPEGEGGNVRSLTDVIKQRKKARREASTRTA